MINKFLQLIDPKNDIKYSTNLYNWISKELSKSNLIRFFPYKNLYTKEIWLGYIDLI